MVAILNLFPPPAAAVTYILSVSLFGGRDIPYLQLDGDNHRGEVFVQLLQHDQLLQSQVEQPVGKHKEDLGQQTSWCLSKCSCNVINKSAVVYSCPKGLSYQVTNEWTAHSLEINTYSYFCASYSPTFTIPSGEH